MAVGVQKGGRASLQLEVQLNTLSLSFTFVTANTVLVINWAGRLMENCGIKRHERGGESEAPLLPGM